MNSMHFTTLGHGPALLFIHGWAMHSGVWTGLQEVFSADFQTMAVDLRGHGKSSAMAGPYTYGACAADIIGLAQQLEVQSITVVGWSMGASILLKAQTLAPGLFDRLVLISGNPSLVTRPDYPCGISEVTVRRLARQVERRYPEGLRNFYDLLLTENELAVFGADPAYRAMTDPAGAPAHAAASATLACLMQEDLRLELSAVTVPTLIVHGAADQICNPRAAAFMHERIPGSRLAIIEQAGHVPFLTRKSTVVEYLRDFLESSS